jgi:hypothetical protein
MEDEAPLAGAFQNLAGIPALRVESNYAPAATPGMPGPYPGRVVSVGIKVNCGGYPHCVSAYEIVADVVRQLTGIGVPA